MTKEKWDGFTNVAAVICLFLFYNRLVRNWAINKLQITEEGFTAYQLNHYILYQAFSLCIFWLILLLFFLITSGEGNFLKRLIFIPKLALIGGMRFFNGKQKRY